MLHSVSLVGPALSACVEVLKAFSCTGLVVNVPIACDMRRTGHGFPFKGAFRDARLKPACIIMALVGMHANDHLNSYGHSRDYYTN